MSHWHFVLGAYAVTLIAIVVEFIAVHLRHRAARRLRDAESRA